MKTIRKILVRLFGLEAYLRLVSRIYIRSISLGLMRKKYSELYFIRQLVHPGDHVLDIGANLAYYSFFMMKSAGKKGRLLAIEPIPLFAGIWKKNMKKLKGYDFRLFNCAVGSDDREQVKMSIPVVNGVVRHGLTKVVEPGNPAGNGFLSYEVPMRNGDQLVGPETGDRLDFIKCDVEGYEQYVIPSLENTIRKYWPVLQVELSGQQNREAVIDFLSGLGYGVYILERHFLEPVSRAAVQHVNQDFYFLHSSRIDRYSGLLSSR